MRRNFDEPLPLPMFSSSKSKTIAKLRCNSHIPRELKRTETLLVERTILYLLQPMIAFLLLCTTFSISSASISIDGQGHLNALGVLSGLPSRALSFIFKMQQASSRSVLFCVFLMVRLFLPLLKVWRGNFWL